MVDNDKLWEQLLNGELEEVPSNLTPEQQAYYWRLADEYGKDCPDPDCICKQDEED